MSKGKKGKEGAKGAGGTGGQKWDEALILEQLDTENWRVCVAAVAGEDFSSEEMVSCLARHISAPTAESRQRRRFYSLSLQEVLKKALEGGGIGQVSKSQASKGKAKGAPSPGGVAGKLPGAEMLAELVKSQNQSEEGPSPDTVARAIKMSLLSLRQEDMARRQQEGAKDGGSRPRSGAGSPGKKDKKGEKATPTGKGKPAGKAGKPSEEGVPMPSKPESTMKKRGEDVGETVFVDDEPVHGPEAYVLLSGVQMPEVLAEMGRVGVSPSCVVRVQGALGVPGSEGEVEGESEKRNKIGHRLREFWRGMEQVLEGSRDAGIRDTGLIQFEYRKEAREGEAVEGLYDTLAAHIYTLVEQKRQHRQFLDCLSLADLSAGKVSKRDKSEGLYRELLAPLPSHSCSVSLLVESMLQQVCIADSNPSIPVEKEVAMSPSLQECLNRIKRRANIGSPSGDNSVRQKTTIYPVIYEGDKIRERESLLDHPTTSQHNGLDRRGVEKRMLDSFYATQLVRRFPNLDQDERSRVNARYQQLLRICKQSKHPLTPPQVQSSLLKLAFAEMEETQTSHLFDDPYPSQDRHASIVPLKPLLSRLQWSEVLARDVIAQRIQDVLAPDKSCSLRYHRQSDSLLLLSHSQSGRELWERRILTPAGFYLYQRFLHAELSPIVEQLSRLNSCEREKLLLTQEQTPNTSQVSLTQLSGKEGRASSLSKSINRASRTSRVKDSRASTPAAVPAQDGTGSREDLLSAQRSEFEQKFVLLSGYDVKDDWYAGKGESDKIQLSPEEFIRCEQRNFHSSPLTSVSVKYCHDSGLSAGISLLMEKSPLHKIGPADTRDSTDSQDDVIAPATLLEPVPGMVYGSYRVSLHSGVQVCLSPYGKLGGLPPPKEMVEDSEIRHLEEELERNTPHSLPPTTSESKVGGKGGGRGKKGEEQQAQEQQRQLTEQRERRRREIERLREDRLLRYRRENKYQGLFLSTPFGLQVTCTTKVVLSNDVTLRDGSDGYLRVTQCYPNSPSPTQSCDKLRLVPASQEVSRSYLEDGTTIKFMKDTTIQMMWPDGSRAYSLQAGELDRLSRQTIELSDLTSDSQHRSLQALSAIVNSHSYTGNEFSLGERQWMYTDKEGQRFVYKWTHETEEEGDSPEERGVKEGEGEGEQVVTPDKELVSTFTAQVYGDPLLCSCQVDPVSEEEMRTREDQVTSVLRKDGTLIVQFPDGTRITSSDSLPCIQIECPGYAKVRFSTPTPGQATITLLESNEIVSHRSGEHSVTSGDVTCHFTADGLLSVRPSELRRVDLDLVSGGEWMRVSDPSQVFAIDKQFHTMRKQKQQKQEAKSEARMFVLTRDGSGMELLSKEIAELELERWRSTKGLLVQSHALPGSTDTIIHSAIKPVTSPPHEMSHLPYTEENIVPVHVRAECYFPLETGKYKGEKKVFGSGVGRGLSIGVPEKSKESVKLPTRAFWRRELLEDRPVSGENLSYLVSSLEELNRCWDGIREERDQSVPVDIRSEAVREETNSLFQQLSSLRVEGRGERLVEEYEERMRTPPPQDTGHAPSERRPERAELEKRERAEFQANMTALRDRDIPGYFESSSGVQFLQQTATAPPDMIQLTEQLPLAMRGGQSQGREQESTSVTCPGPFSEKLMLPRLSELSQDAGLAQGYASTTILLPDTLGSATSLAGKERPENPSPHVPVSTEPSAYSSEASSEHTPANTHEDPGADRPQNPVTTQTGRNPIPEYLFYNVAGVPRTAPVKLPTSIKTLRPGDRESERTDETKKQPNTASLSMPLSKSLKQGISLQQTELDFGLLKEGGTYSATVHIKNIGIISTRYKIKAPPPCTGLWASYTPHPIAAGMSASFQVEIYAVPVGVVGERGRGRVEHNLEIISEVNTLSLPITATVLTVTSYDEEVGELLLARGVTLLPGASNSRDAFRGVKK